MGLIFCAIYRHYATKSELWYSHHENDLLAFPGRGELSCLQRRKQAGPGVAKARAYRGPRRGIRERGGDKGGSEPARFKPKERIFDNRKRVASRELGPLGCPDIVRHLSGRCPTLVRTHDSHNARSCPDTVRHLYGHCRTVLNVKNTKSRKCSVNLHVYCVNELNIEQR